MRQQDKLHNNLFFSNYYSFLHCSGGMSDSESLSGYKEVNTLCGYKHYLILFVTCSTKEGDNLKFNFQRRKEY